MDILVANSRSDPNHFTTDTAKKLDLATKMRQCILDIDSEDYEYEEKICILSAFPSLIELLYHCKVEG